MTEQVSVASAVAFEWLCGELERVSSFDRLEARGTIRLALRQAGLDAQSVTPDQMQVVVTKLLPAELDARGVPQSQEICASLLPGLQKLGEDCSDSDVADTPDEIFRRLGGD